MQKRLLPAWSLWPLWHAATLIGLATLTGLRFGMPPWRFTDQIRSVVFVLSVGYVLGALLVHVLSRRRSKVTLLDTATAALAGYSPLFLYIIVQEVQFPRSLLIAGLVGAVVSLSVGFASPRVRRPALLVMCLGIAALITYTARTGTQLNAPAAKTTFTRQIATSLYPIQVTTNRNFIPRSESYHAGGGIAAIGEGEYLAVTSDGALLYVVWDAWNQAPKVAPLAYRTPLNRPAFIKAAGRGAYANYFRALDVLVLGDAQERRLLVSHHYWNEDHRCFVVRISALPWPDGVPPSSLGESEWSIVHESEPCLPLVLTEPLWPFRGMEGGGRMALLDDSTLLLTVGDQGFNGVDFEHDFVQNTNSSYGKVVAVDTRDGSWEVFTTGHRNPQGLVVDGEEVWSTEHGPQGGDELNRLHRGANFGWPLVTYGTDYGRNSWPLNTPSGRHDGFDEPLFAWLPSIAPSNLVRVKSGLFGSWRDDLLIGSLVGESLWRVHLNGAHVSAMEEIPIGERIRDIAEDASGRIVMLTDSYSFLVLEPMRTAYATCAGCHGPVDGSAPRLGPSLDGIVGRAVASSPAYEYSDALRTLDGNWTEQRLDEFLRDPQAFAPGTRMVIPGIDDVTVRTEIIRYLKGQR